VSTLGSGLNPWPQVWVLLTYFGLAISFFHLLGHFFSKKKHLICKAKTMRFLFFLG